MLILCCALVKLPIRMTHLGLLDEYNPNLEKFTTCLALVEAADFNVDAANNYTVFINR